MVDDFLSVSSAFSSRLKEASDLIDVDLTEIVKNGPIEELNRTEITQPALLATSVAMYEHFQSAGGPSAELLAGHSVGEYTALVVSSALAFSDGVELVHQRGRLMQQAVPTGEGLMAAVIGLEDHVVEEICTDIDGVVSPANYNSPGQLVIAGNRKAVEIAADRCQENGARRVIPLEVSVPSHCSLMDSASAGLLGLLDDAPIQVPQVPVYQNVNAKPSTDPDAIRSGLVEQVKSPVLWTECIRSMIRDGATEFFECGPGRVLAGLMRRIDRSAVSVALGDFSSFMKQVEVFK